MVAVTPRSTKTRTRPRPRPRPKTIFPKLFCERFQPHPPLIPRREYASANLRMFTPDVTKCTRGPPQAWKRGLREALYDKRHALYKDRPRKSDIWKAIGTETDKLVNIIGTRFLCGVTAPSWASFRFAVRRTGSMEITQYFCHCWKKNGPATGRQPDTWKSGLTLWVCAWHLPLRKALYHNCFIRGQLCKWWFRLL